MKLQVVAIGTRLDDWINSGFENYARRLPPETPLQLVEVKPAQRRGLPLARVLADEGKRLLSCVAAGDRVVALDVAGRNLSTEALAEKFDDWRMQGSNVTFLIGGADGLDESCLMRADERLSLSALTFPHGLVRIMLAEQLYRAWTLLVGHPYHRA